MADVLAIHNTWREGLGNLRPLLESDGFSIDSVSAMSGIPEADPSLVVVLGGPQSVSDNAPHLLAEQEAIRGYMSKGTPVLGICLGSQLIAAAAGGSVARGPVPEIGFYDMPRSDDPLLSGLPDPFTVFHWHMDGMSPPPQAEVVAGSEHYPCQALRVGSAVGVQFHLEVDAQMAGLWLDNSAAMLAKAGVDAGAVKAKIPEMMPRVEAGLRAFYANFKSESGLGL